MAKCDICGRDVPLPYTCGYCGGSFCSKHRLPENHLCSGLDEMDEKTRREGKIYRGVSEDLKEKPREDKRGQFVKIPLRFSEESEGSGRKFQESSGGFGSSLGFLKDFFFHDATTTLLVIMVSMYIIQVFVRFVYGMGVYSEFIDFLAPTRNTVLSMPWTVFTSIFLHGNSFHLFINGIVLFFIGSALERRIGSSRFVFLFLVAGALASIAQLVMIDPNIAVLGASGAIFGILGALTVLTPRMPVLLFFFLPMQLWMLTLGYGLVEALLAFRGAGDMIGHMAHFSGLVIGLIYGFKLRGEGVGTANNPLELIMRKYGY